MSISPFSNGNPFHAAKRAAELVAALTKFGFGEFVTHTGLRKHLPRRLRPTSTDPTSTTADPAPVRLRLLIEELGPTFIKAGQILSTRPDLIPVEFANELKKLQSNVPAAPYEGDDRDKHVHAVLKAALGDQLDTAFTSVSPKPLAAASIGQVHTATLADGTPVVLKVLRPGIHDVVAADLQLMRWLAGIADAHLSNLGFNAEDVVEEFARQIQRETDLTLECESTTRMAEDFADDENIGFPKVYKHLSSRNVLVLEHVQGTLLSDLDVQTLDESQRTTLVQNAADAVFRQCLSLGFFHADPHPGNIFVHEDMSLTFIDCGMVGQIDPRSAQQLAQITHGTIEAELDRVVRTAIQIADADPAYADDRGFRSDVWRFIDHFKAGTLESIRMGKLLDEFFGVLRDHGLRCPADIVYLIKSLTTIEGVAQAIAPDFDLVGHVRPYVTKLIHQRFGFKALRRRVRNNLVAYADLMEFMPHQLADLMRIVRQGRTTLHLHHDNIDRLTREVEQASRHISWALVVASIILGSSVLVLADHLQEGRSPLTLVAIVGFVSAVALVLVRFLMPRKS